MDSCGSVTVISHSTTQALAQSVKPIPGKDGPNEGVGDRDRKNDPSGRLFEAGSSFKFLVYNAVQCRARAHGRGELRRIGAIVAAEIHFTALGGIDFI